MYSEKVNEKYTIAEHYKSTWSRIKKLVLIIGEQIFHGNDSNPFSSKKDRLNSKKEEWITTLDPAFLMWNELSYSLYNICLNYLT